MSNTVLPNCGRLEVRSSPIEGNGVFAKDFIAKDEVLEEVPFVMFPRYLGLAKALYETVKNQGFLNPRETYLENLRGNLQFKDPEKYYFKWFPPVQLEGEAVNWTVLPLGFGPIYNTSNTDNNAGWIVKDKTFVFKAERDIQKDEEIRTFYGYFLGEEGSIFNCDTVFGLALDRFGDVVRTRMVRFGSKEAFEQARLNPVYPKIAQMIQESKEGLQIKRIVALLPNMEERVPTDVPANASVGQIYQKLAEYRSSQFPLTRVHFEYERKDGQKIEDNVIFRK